MAGAGGERGLLLAGALAAVLGLAGTARADSAADATAAQALFDDAKALMKSGDYAAACPKLDESERLQPAGGTLMFLGLCRESEGKTATAWAKLNEALSAARRDNRPDREKVAQEHIAALTPRLTRLTLALSDEAKATAGLEVRLDGEVVALALMGTAVPVDPGDHALHVTAPGMKAWDTTAKTAGEGATSTLTVPALEKDPNAVTTPPTPVVAPTPGTATSAPPPPADTGASPGSTQRTIALVVGGAGVVALGIGTYFGVAALSKKGDENAQCPGGSTGPCNPTGVSISQTAASDGNVASVLLGVGAVAVVGAGVLWLTAPKGTPTAAWRVSPLVGRDSAGLTVQGGW
jgi:hypothetical protein